MDSERINLIIRNIELLIDALKVELHQDSKSYKFDDIELSEIDQDQIIDDLLQ